MTDLDPPDIKTKLAASQVHNKIENLISIIIKMIVEIRMKRINLLSVSRVDQDRYTKR